MLQNPNRTEEQEKDYDPSVWPKRYSPSLRSAASFLSVLGLLTVLFIYISVPLSALSILFALLSGGAGKMHKKARRSVRRALIAMAASSLFTGYAFYRVNHDPALKLMVQQMVDQYRRLYGGDFLPGYPGSAGNTPAPAAPDAPALPNLSDPDSILDYYLSPKENSGEAETEEYETQQYETQQEGGEPVPGLPGEDTPAELPDGGAFI